MSRTTWEIEGPSFGGCNCDWNCPCQYNLKPTHNQCEGLDAMRIDQGHYGDVPLEGLLWATFYKWPGAVEDGDGQFQAVIDERADASQREALSEILYGRASAEGSYFDIMASTMSRQYDPLFLPIEFDSDQEARRGRLVITDVMVANGEPIADPHSGGEHRIRLDMPDGFEFSLAEIGNLNARAGGEFEVACENTYGQWARYHFNQDGIVR